MKSGYLSSLRALGTHARAQTPPPHTHTRVGGGLPPTHTLPRIHLLTRSPLSSQDIASPKFSMPSPVRTVIAADFDNDQELEIFFNNFAHRSASANRLFR